MTRFYGKIGFAVDVDEGHGVWGKAVTEKNYKGDVLTNMRRYETRSDSTNDDLLVNNKISILSDSFARENIGNVLFAEWGGTCWKVTNVEIQYPRLILTLGGVYNGDRSES